MPALGLAVAIVIACGACGLAARSRPAPGDEAGSIDVGGTTRTWNLHVPPAAAASAPLPLVVSLHGGGGAGASSDRISGLDGIADSDGFYVAKPEGLDRGWNDGRTDGDQSEARLGTDDVGFLVGLVDAVSASHAVDRSRVYAVGISNGAMMSLRLVCERPDVFGGAVAVAGSLPVTSGRCVPGRPVRVALVAGTADPLVPYDGGNVGLDGGRGRVVGAPATADSLATTMECLPTGAVALSDTVTEKQWSCPGGGAVALVTVSGGGHTWPGGPQYLPERVIGPADPWPASPWMWSFLSGVA